MAEVERRSGQVRGEIRQRKAVPVLRAPRSARAPQRVHGGGIRFATDDGEARVRMGGEQFTGDGAPVLRRPVLGRTSRAGVQGDDPGVSRGGLQLQAHGAARERETEAG